MPLRTPQRIGCNIVRKIIMEGKEMEEINKLLLNAMRNIALAAQEDSITLTQLAHLADAQESLTNIVKKLNN